MTFIPVINNARLGADAVESDNINDDSIVNADINSAAAIAYSKLDLSGSITSGDITNGTITNDDINASAAIAYSKLDLVDSIDLDDIATNVTLDGLAALNATAGAVAMNSNNFTGLSSATTAGEAVEYTQFAAALDGLSYKDAVRVATAAALPAYTRTTNVITADANGALPSIDGVSLSVNDRLILKNGADPEDNGIYEVTDLGDGSNPFVLTRTDDANSAAEIDDGATAWVQQGTANADTRWTQTATVATLNTDAVTWAQTGSATTVSAIDDLSDVDTTGKVDGSLFRYDTGSGSWGATTGSNLLLTDAGQLQVPTAGASAGILLGGDAQWYSDSGVMRTPDAVTIDGDLTTDGARFMDVSTVTGAGSNATLPSATEVLIVDSSSDTHTVDLEALAGQLDRRVTIKREGANTVTLDPNSTELIEGVSTYDLDEDGMSLTILAATGGWRII